MTNEEYFKHEALSASKIKMILNNPYNFFNGIEPAKNPSMEFGEKVHKLILESDLKKTFDGKDIVVEPNFGKMTLKVNKEAKEKFLECNKDNYIVSEDEFLCAASVLESPLGALFKLKGEREKAYFGKILGRDFKCKPDFYLQFAELNGKKTSICIDIKTCQDISEHMFTRNVANFGYHIQNYIYSNILNCETFLFIAVDKNTKQVACYNLTSDWLSKAENDILKAFSIIDNEQIYNQKCRVFDVDEYNNPVYIKELAMPSYFTE